MIILGKILIFVFSFCLLPHFVDSKEYFLLILGIILCVSIFYDLYIKYNRFIEGSYNYSSKGMRIYGYSNYYSNSNNNRYMPSGYSYSSYYEKEDDKIAKSIKIRSDKAEFIDEKILYNKEIKPSINKESIKLLPIKEIVGKELEKKNKVLELNNTNKPTISLNKENKIKSTTESITIVNDYIGDKRKIVYDSIIEIIKGKKYIASKTLKLLKCFECIDIFNDTVTIYVNEQNLDNSDVIPIGEIKNAIRRNLHNYTLNIIVNNMNHINVLDYYEKKYISLVI